MQRARSTGLFRNDLVRFSASSAADWAAVGIYEVDDEGNDRSRRRRRARHDNAPG